MIKKRKTAKDLIEGSQESTMLIYTIKDTVSQDIGPLFESVSDDVACRKIAHDLSSMPPSLVNDYELYCIGYVKRGAGEVKLQYEEARIVDFRPLWHVLQGIRKAQDEKANKKALEAVNESN